MSEEKEPVYIGEYEPEDEIVKINRFYSPLAGAKFYNAPPITDEDHKKVEAMWEALTGGNYTPAKEKGEKP